jgi:hypothetical protein
MILYKYCDSKGIDILEKRRLKLSKISDFNDPFEFKLSYDGRITFESVFEELSNDNATLERLYNLYVNSRLYKPRLKKPSLEISEKDKEHFKKWFRSWGKLPGPFSFLQEEYNKRIESAVQGIDLFNNSNYRIVCLSACSDSILMWSHYGDSHRGILIRFNADKFPLEMNIDDSLIEVKYSENRVILPPSLNTEHFYEALLQLGATKHAGWSYEKEYRIIFEYVGKADIHYFDIEPSLIHEVVLGMRCPEATEARIKEIIASQDFKHVVLKKADMHPNKFDIIYRIQNTGDAD